MHEVLGLTYRNGSFYCTQRGELTKITDTDHDGVPIGMMRSIVLTSVATTMSTLMDPSFDKNGDMYVTSTLPGLATEKDLGNGMGGY